MAIGWLTLLKSVPWTEVVSNAPLVADGARKLWNATLKKSPAAVIEPEVAEAASPEEKAVSVLTSRVAVLELLVSDLHSQMVATSEVVKALAEQNTQLVHRVETMRIRVLWLAAVLLVFGIIAVAGLLLMLLR